MRRTQTTGQRGSLEGSRARSGVLSVVLWTFGLATSLFLLGMWGRTVAVDTATIEESARTIIDSDIATDRINIWFEEGLATVADLDSEAARTVVQTIESSPEYGDAVDTIIAGFVDSLFAEQGETTTVDLERALAPLVPIVVAEFARRDVPVEVGQIEDVLDDAGVVDLDAGQAASIAAVVTDARVFLTQVVVVSLFALILTGALALLLGHERWAMVRLLSSRMMVAALSYAVILKLAGWALDPGRGRSPIAGGSSVLFESNSQILLILGAIAGAVTAVAYGIARRRRIQGADQPRDVVDDDTRELIVV